VTLSVYIFFHHSIAKEKRWVDHFSLTNKTTTRARNLFDAMLGEFYVSLSGIIATFCPFRFICVRFSQNCSTLPFNALTVVGEKYASRSSVNIKHKLTLLPNVWQYVLWQYACFWSIEVIAYLSRSVSYASGARVELIKASFPCS
jgi:hypothetical protein